MLQVKVPSGPLQAHCNLLSVWEGTFCRAVVDVGYAFVDDGGIVVEVVIELALVDELGILGADWFEFDCDLKVGFGVDALVDLSECSLVDFPYDFVIFPNLLNHLRHFKLALKIL